MSAPARVFVNGVALDVQPGATALDAVRGWSREAAEAVVRGRSIITDSRGLPTPADVRVQAGAIFRVVPVRAPRGGAAAAGGDETP